MRLSSLRVQNFRAFKDESLELDSYTCLVGQNGAGKSTWLAALNIFFRDASAPITVDDLCEEDFHHRKTSVPIIITLTFKDLSDAAKSDFRHYFRQDQLIVKTVCSWIESERRVDVVQQGVRLVMKDFEPYFAKVSDHEKVGELRSAYAEARTKYPTLPDVKVKKDMEMALRNFEEEHPDLCERSDSSDQFYGVSRGKNLLEKYLTWVYVPAVKDAMSEQEEARSSVLGKLLARTIRSKISFDVELDSLLAELERRYREVIDNKSGALSTLSDTLQGRLQEWTNPSTKLELQWHYQVGRTIVVGQPTAKVHVGEGGFLGELARLGHGVQRAFIVTLLQELAQGGDVDQPTMLLAIEEPELYQHPSQSRHLSSELQRIAQGNSQVIVTSHSPLFVSGRGFESIRLVRRQRSTGVSTISQYSFAQLATALNSAVLDGKTSRPSEVMAAIGQILNPTQNEMFFCEVPILVEGTEDVAAISTYLHLLDKWPEFRRLGCHFVVAVGKTNLSRLVAISKGLGQEPFLVFDGDRKEAERDKKRVCRDNGALLTLMGHDGDALAPDGHRFSNLVMWPNDMTEVIRSAVPPHIWATTCAQVRGDNDWSNGVRRKNSMLVAAVLNSLWQRGHRSAPLVLVCESILKHAKTVV